MHRYPRHDGIRLRSAWLVWVGTAFVPALSRCSHPTYFPDAPAAEVYSADGTRVGYDVDRDGRLDYAQTYHGPVKRVFHFSPSDHHSPSSPKEVNWDSLDLHQEKHLFLLLDGVPFDLMAELWTEGHFRLFHRPGVLVSSLPSLTDVAFAQILGSGAPAGYESAYFDRCHNQLTDGTHTYLRGANEPWRSALDYRLNFIEDAIMYLFPKYVFRRELENSRRILARSDRTHPVVYMLSTDGLCHMTKRTDAMHYLRLLDRFIERLVYDHGARLQVTMLADHGNSFVPTRPLPLRGALKAAGLRLGKSLRRSGDVVLPAFGLIDFAALYVFDEATLERVIDVCLSSPGVELVCHRQSSPGGIVVLSGPERALIRRNESPLRYRYTMLQGDPLALAPILDRLAKTGHIDEDGFAPDEAWLAATYDHVFPDPLHRLWRALFENTGNPADVVVSLTPAYHVGDASLDSWVNMEGTHGGLRKGSSNTFVMSTGFDVPAYMRPADVLRLINRHVPWSPRVHVAPRQREEAKVHTVDMHSTRLER